MYVGLNLGKFLKIEIHHVSMMLESNLNTVNSFFQGSLIFVVFVSSLIINH